MASPEHLGAHDPDDTLDHSSHAGVCGQAPLSPQELLPLPEPEVTPTLLHHPAGSLLLHPRVGTVGGANYSTPGTHWSSRRQINGEMNIQASKGNPTFSTWFPILFLVPTHHPLSVPWTPQQRSATQTEPMKPSWAHRGA